MFEKELDIALQAVELASRATDRAQLNIKSVDKSDDSPVTSKFDLVMLIVILVVADFAAQAIVNHALSRHFPDDGIIAEETSEELQNNPKLAESVIKLVQSVCPFITDVNTLIDLGSSEGGAKGRYWVLDPIDGTKGYLRGGQYAICLGLIVDGIVTVGVLGCPNLLIKEVSGGCLLGAIQGQGAFLVPRMNPKAVQTRLKVSPITDPALASTCESVESGHSDHSWSAAVARNLNISREPVRMDSQCKYAIVACGQSDIYMRFPTRPGYREKIWDHAAGDLIVREAGGKVTDLDGKELDFSRGRTLQNNKGIIATNGAIHARVLDAVKKSLPTSSL
jgi:3'(2'), 5'-bisphosphate nucleotidase